MLEIVFNSVTKSYHSKVVLDDFSLKIQKGERVVIFGPSGCGKTTLIHILAGLVVPEKGSVLINDKIVAQDGINLVEPEKRNIGMVFQDLALWPHMTVKQNLEFGLKARHILKQEREQRINNMLKRMHIREYINARPSEISGGQQQRVALARALVLEPTALLMDEPLSSLDRELSLKLRKEILNLQKEIGFTLVYVTHDKEEADEIGNRIIQIE